MHEIFGGIEEETEKNKEDDGKLKKPILEIILNEIQANYDEKFCCFDTYTCEHKITIIFIYKGYGCALIECNKSDDCIYIRHKSDIKEFCSVKNCCYNSMESHQYVRLM